jgi:biotin transport system substrate-specific component
MPVCGLNSMINLAETEVRGLGSGADLILPQTAGWWASRRGVVSVLGCCLLMTLGAHIRVPVPGSEVPMTLQLLAVLLAGFALPPAHAVGGMLLYLACGAFGFPVFAPGSMGLIGPTGGYIVGFVGAVWLISALKGGPRAGVFRLFLVGAAAAAVVLLPGVAWRAALFGGDMWLSVKTGLLPFVPKAVVEVLLAVTLATAIRSLQRRPATSRAL